MAVSHDLFMEFQRQMGSQSGDHRPNNKSAIGSLIVSAGDRLAGCSAGAAERLTRFGVVGWVTPGGMVGCVGNVSKRGMCGVELDGADDVIHHDHRGLVAQARPAS